MVHYIDKISSIKENITDDQLLNMDMCKLHNTKKDSYYVHTYDPTNLIKRFQSENNIDTNAIQHIDMEVTNNCCNVISIFLSDCDKHPDKLYSINRTIINVKKKLKDWIVRIYVISSVYNCIKKSKNQKILKKIENSKNVEIYLCDCCVNDKFPVERIKTVRLLPMFDPEVNICVIREENGIVTNLDCHNISIFAKSDKLFYLPKIAKNLDNIKKGHIDQTYTVCMKTYKTIFRHDFFSHNKNVYNILAGAFSTKIKFKRSYYLENVKYLSQKMNILLESKEAMMSLLKNFSHIVTGLSSVTRYANNQLTTMLNNGFDEILLLDILKDVISTQLTDSIETINKLKNIFFSDNVATYQYEYNIKKTIGTFLSDVHSDLIEKNIITGKLNLPNHIKNPIRNPKLILWYIDSLLLRNIISKHVFNINVLINSYVLKINFDLFDLIDTSYSIDYDKLYDSLSGGDCKSIYFSLNSFYNNHYAITS